MFYGLAKLASGSRRFHQGRTSCGCGWSCPDISLGRQRFWVNCRLDGQRTLCDHVFLSQAGLEDTPLRIHEEGLVFVGEQGAPNFPFKVILSLVHLLTKTCWPGFRPGWWIPGSQIPTTPHTCAGADSGWERKRVCFCLQRLGFQAHEKESTTN